MKRRRFLAGRLVVLGTTFLTVTQLAVFGATIKNRWSFNETGGTTAHDSVGGQHGTLYGPSAYFEPTAGVDGSGAVVLWNGGPGQSIESGSPECDYVAFPPNLVTGYTAITVEVWFLPFYHNVPFADWNRLWDFGNSDGTGVPGYFFFRAGSEVYSAGGNITIPGPFTQSFYPAGLYPKAGDWNHLVWCSDGVSGKLRIYLNGVLFAIDGFTNTPALAGPTTNNWLARSQFNVDRALSAYYDEFRIYDGTINALEVAANYQNGPGVFPPAYGAVTSLVLRVVSPMPVGVVRAVELLAGASALTNNAVDIRETPGVVYTSSDTNILTVSADGLVIGRSPGTATITASYAGLVATQQVQVRIAPARLAHRYSFERSDDVAHDSVGGQHGWLVAGAAQSAGRVYLDGEGAFVNLPPNLLAPTNIQNGAVTFVAWMTAYPVQYGGWARLFDFGRQEGLNGARYIFFAPNTATNGGVARLAVSDTSPGWMSEDGFNVGHVLGQTNLQVIAVWNPMVIRQFLGLFLNGTLAGWMTTTKSYESVDNQNSWLGRSLYGADAYLYGEIDEFRIYDGELDRIQIAATYQYGPNSTNLDIGEFVSFTLDRGAPTLALGQVRQAACFINFQHVTNVNLIGDPPLTLTSSDTNVVTITSPGGLITATGVGTATLTAVYRYVRVVGSVYATNFYTSSTTISVVIPSATMVHRYTFNQTSGLIVPDVVGGAHGVIRAATNVLGVTNFVWTGGTTLGINTTGSVWDAYVELPPGIISRLTNNATFEVWVSTTPAMSADWQRIFDFGSVPGQPNIFLTRRFSTANLPRFDWQTGFVDDGNVGSPWVTGWAHIVVVYDDANDSVVMYRNGVRVAQSAAATTSLASLTDTNNWLGRSLFAVDPFFRGTYNEFRIYSGLLTEAEIRRNNALGADQLITNAPLYFGVTGGNVVLSWPNYAARFTLESSPVLGPGATWTPVSAAITQSGTNYQVSVPIGSGAQFFRLRRSGF